MPNIFGKVTKNDFIAPARKYRVIVQDLDDGEFRIEGDFTDLVQADRIATQACSSSNDSIAMVYDDTGWPLVSHFP